MKCQAITVDGREWIISGLIAPLETITGYVQATDGQVYPAGYSSPVWSLNAAHIVAYRPLYDDA